MASKYESYLQGLGIQFPPRAMQEAYATASTDQGDVSYEIPQVHPVYKIDTPEGVGNHTPGFAEVCSRLLPPKYLSYFKYFCFISQCGCGGIVSLVLVLICRRRRRRRRLRRLLFRGRGWRVLRLSFSVTRIFANKLGRTLKQGGKRCYPEWNDSPVDFMIMRIYTVLFFNSH